MKNNDTWVVAKRKKSSLPTTNIVKSEYKQTDKQHEKKYNILCINMVSTGTCKYADKCIYAHSLSEQVVLPLRKMAYDIIINKKNISNINLHEKYDLYNTFLGMYRVCNKCKNNTCTGGYNCKYGVISEKYKICIKDLKYGDCSETCQCVHLTKQGLKPFYSNPPHGVLLTPESTEIKKIDITGDLPIDIDDESSDGEVTDVNEQDECLISIFE